MSRSETHRPGAGEKPPCAADSPAPGGPHGLSQGRRVRGCRYRRGKNQAADDDRAALSHGGVRLSDGRMLVWQARRDNGPLRRVKRRIRYWRSLAQLLAPSSPVKESRLNGWLLVLEAKKIPHVFSPGGEYPFLYIPPVYEGVALHEIRAFEGERPVPVFAPPVRNNVAGVLCCLLGLVVWHGLRWGWFVAKLPSPPFPAAAQSWSGLFGLDVYRLRVLHEGWRAVTALTLHADFAHLLGNVVFGLFFFIPLCRRAGLGLGIALALVAGILGNIGNALTRETQVISLGFSTALFGSVGSLCVLAAADMLGHYRRFTPWRFSGVLRADPVTGDGLCMTLARRLGPLAAGLALLGILGGGGEARTDYAAHIWGFGCGLLCALAALPLERAIFRQRRAKQHVIQCALLALGLGVVVWAWHYALGG